MATSDKDVAHENYSGYVYARDNGHVKFLQKADKCEDFVSGLHWDDASLQKLAMQRRPALTINMTMAIILSLIGEEIENRVDVSFAPFKNNICLKAGQA